MQKSSRIIVSKQFKKFCSGDTKMVPKNFHKNGIKKVLKGSIMMVLKV